MSDALEKVLAKKYAVACKHRHVSGRRCGQRIAQKLVYCGLHNKGQCAECDDMLLSFGMDPFTR